jgi:hypothetical protein
MRSQNAAMLALILGVAPWLAAYGEDQLQSTITREKATQLAERFFESEIAFEGALGEPSVQGNSWAFPVRLGYAGTVQPSPLLVNRNTGKASWADLDAFREKYGRTRKGSRQ